MSRIAYVNGRYVPHSDAAVHVEDRGYQFADGVYEVIAVRGGAAVDLGLHLDRLSRSLAALSIAEPMSRRALAHILRQVVVRNRVRDGIVYLQITRGVAPRNHPFPRHVRPSVVVTARPGVGPRAAQVEEGGRVVSVPDARWARRDVKSVSLLPNVLAKQAAVEKGAYEAWLTMPDGTVTEASASNAWIVTADGTLVTHPLGHDILPGVTRKVVLDLARAAGMTVAERAFTLDEAKAAREAFITSTTAFVLAVTQIDDTVVGNGHPGEVARALRALYQDRMAGAAAWTVP
ncbi:D-amino-acid transaminase [Novispirillum sp. DQ9]|uniref:D-amino-acid transaminase n=1 Tax=Novispirillum sp. DQ9 TaxID=3398612 RepID=UPI003C7DBF5A